MCTGETEAGTGLAVLKGRTTPAPLRVDVASRRLGVVKCLPKRGPTELQEWLLLGGKPDKVGSPALRVPQAIPACKTPPLFLGEQAAQRLWVGRCLCRDGVGGGGGCHVQVGKRRPRPRGVDPTGTQTPGQSDPAFPPHLGSSLFEGSPDARC